MAKANVFLCGYHHSDLIWRRTKAGYDKVRQKQLLNVLRLLDKYPQFRFFYDQAEVLSMFLQQHPELKDKIKSLVKESKIEIAGGFWSLPDTNLISGESLVRNHLLGLAFFQKELGVRPAISSLTDAFGMNAQLPQILKGLGVSCLLPGRMPGLPEEIKNEFVWKGIDGTEIVVLEPIGTIQTCTHVCNVPVIYTQDERIRISLEELGKGEKEGPVFAVYATEEELLKEDIFPVIKEYEKRTGEKIVWASPSQYLSDTEARKLPGFTGEFNPIFTGCYTTRITVKQKNRRAENLLVNSETIMSLASMSANFAYPKDALTVLWKKLFICQFHDGICGCHIDSVTDFMDESFDKIISESKSFATIGLRNLLNVKRSDQNGLAIFNPLNWKRSALVAITSKDDMVLQDTEGNAVNAQRSGEEIYCSVELPSLGYKFFNLSHGKVPEGSIVNAPTNYETETEHYLLEAGEDGFKITPKFLSADLFSDGRFGEILFREDGGDLWQEEFLGAYFGEEVQKEEVRYVEEGPLFTRVVLHGEVVPLKKGFEHYQLWDGFDSLSWIKEFVFLANSPLFYLRLWLDWKGSCTKIHISFPVNVNPEKAKAYYEIPFGCVERRPYFEVPYGLSKRMKAFSPDVLQRAKGDWPALSWVLYEDDEAGLAVANRGTPGCQLNGGKVIVSLLRSPVRKESQSRFYPGKGALENGERFYEFAFRPLHTSDIHEAFELGWEFNNPPVRFSVENGAPALPEKEFVTVSDSGIILASFKKAEDNAGYILRLFEALGKERSVQITLHFPYKKIWATTLVEQKIETLSSLKLKWKPFEIKTFLVET